MYEKFTDRARKVMQLACEEARSFNHEYIGTEHILLGLISEGTGAAGIALKNLRVNPRKVRGEVERIVQAGPDMVTMGRLPQTPRAKKVVEYAIEESRNFNHNYVGTEHLLLGLLRESEGVAAQVLMNLGLRLDTVRNEVLRLVGDQAGRSSPAAESHRDVDFDNADFDDGEITEAEEIPKPEIRHLPESAREIIAEFDCQIDVIKEEKEQAVGAPAWERAAELRDLEYKLRKLRDEFISHWPKD